MEETTSSAVRLDLIQKALTDFPAKTKRTSSEQSPGSRAFPKGCGRRDSGLVSPSKTSAIDSGPRSSLASYHDAHSDNNLPIDQHKNISANPVEEPFVDRVVATALNLQARSGSLGYIRSHSFSESDNASETENLSNTCSDIEPDISEAKEVAPDATVPHDLHLKRRITDSITDKLVSSKRVSLAKADKSAHQRKKDAALAWKHFSRNLRQLQTTHFRAYSCHEPQPEVCLNPSADLVLPKPDVQQYIDLLPNKDIALLSFSDNETVATAQVLSSCLSLRNHFILDLPDVTSPCVRPAQLDPNKTQGFASTEPVFDPLSVPLLPKCDACCAVEDGVYTVYWSCPEKQLFSGPPKAQDNPSVYKGQKLLDDPARPFPTVAVFLNALKHIMTAAQHPTYKSFTYQRLQYLQNRFRMHLMFNSKAELEETKRNHHRDFYNVRKVDTHVHHSACMHQKHLLRFIRKKHHTEPHVIVAKSQSGEFKTLDDIFSKEVGVTAWDTSVDLLNVHALGSCFHRFDKFNLKYNPFGQPLLREVFLKTNNLIKGRYLAEITKEVIAQMEEQKYQMAEWRLSIYGKSYDEWSKLAQWVHDNGLISKQIRWMIQVPRLYHVHRKLNLIENFADLLRNVFQPVFEAVLNPQDHPFIYRFLLQMNGWDSVDDESVVSKYTSEGGSLPMPEQWTTPTNPPYSYWAYYMYANIRNLNLLLAARNMRTLPFRPHCGEAGSISHLASMYLLADGINHGILLRKTPVLQYLFYLTQIGLAISPLSNNALFHDITRNPFYTFFCVGLNVSLSTDDPLMFHFTEEPLLEEYSCCAHVWKLSPVDLCEIARNSVLQSHFDPQFKTHWLGHNYRLPGSKGNDIRKTNTSNIRVQYRENCLLSELKYLRDILHLHEAAAAQQKSSLAHTTPT